MTALTTTAPASLSQKLLIVGLCGFVIFLFSGKDNPSPLPEFNEEGASPPKLHGTPPTPTATVQAPPSASEDPADYILTLQASDFTPQEIGEPLDAETHALSAWAVNTQPIDIGAPMNADPTFEAPSDETNPTLSPINIGRALDTDSDLFALSDTPDHIVSVGAPLDVELY